MKYTLLLAPLLLSSCVTSGDLDQVANSVRNLELVAADRYSTQEDLEEAIDATGQEIADVARRAEERARAIAEGVPESPSGWLALLLKLGVAAGAGTVATNKVRDRRRKLRGEPTDPLPMKPQGPNG